MSYIHSLEKTWKNQGYNGGHFVASMYPLIQHHARCIFDEISVQLYARTADKPANMCFPRTGKDLKNQDHIEIKFVASMWH